MKRKQLTMAQLGTMSYALMKNLFPTPGKTDLLVEEQSTAKGDGLFLYFSDSYYEILITKMKDYKNSGAYANSNAESDWIDLMNAVLNAENISSLDSKNLRPHFLAR